MTWTEAVDAMRAGHAVRRRSQMYRRAVAPDVTETGEEACMLAHAWTVDERPVLVFRGADSRVLFVPDTDDRGAQDWTVVQRQEWAS